MIPPSDWKNRLERFFYDRGMVVRGIPTLYDHCIVSAKDPRVSARADMHEDVISSIAEALCLRSDSNVLEVGCASGYIACGLAERIGHYTGVDLAAPPLAVARKMKLANAKFIRSDGASMPFTTSEFDAALAYDVFSNFPDFQSGVPLIREMLRVVKPGGLVMVGSLTNKQKGREFEARVNEFAASLLAEYGPQPVPSIERPSLIQRVARKLLRNDPPHAVSEVVFYYFDPDDFRIFACREGLRAVISDIHPMNPYRGFRYNVVFTKPLFESPVVTIVQ